MKLSQRQVNYNHCCGGRRISPNREKSFPLHRISTVMQQEEVTSRTIASRLGKSEGSVRKESQPTHDMLLSELYRWQEALGVPVSDLLAEAGLGLSTPVQLRTRLLKMMRSVRSIQELSKEESTQALAMRLSEQLMEMMPELEDVSGWPAAGQSRKSSELGAVAYNLVSEKSFDVPLDDI